MSQKTNPISLRLQKSNKHFESCWYSDLFYGQVLGDEIKLRTYLEGILYQAARSKTLPSIQSQYKRYCTFLFFLDQRAERHKREFSLKLLREPTEHVLLPRIKFLPIKNKVGITNWQLSLAEFDLLFNKAQDILCRESLPQEEIYNYLIEGAKQKRSGFSYNDIQEYVYNYAIKGSSLEVLSLNSVGKKVAVKSFLSGADSVKCFNKKAAHYYNTIINPGLNRNSSSNNGQNVVYIKSKGFLDFSMISYVLGRDMPYIQKAPLKAPPLLPQPGNSTTEVGFAELSKAELPTSSVLLLSVAEHVSTTREFATQSSKAEQESVKKTFDGVEALPQSGLSNASKTRHTIFLKSGVTEESTINIFSVEGGCKNLFRRLIIDRHSQSTQNRLSYSFVRGLEKQLGGTKILSILADKSLKCLDTLETRQNSCTTRHTTSHSKVRVTKLLCVANSRVVDTCSATLSKSTELVGNSALLSSAKPTSVAELPSYQVNAVNQLEKTGLKESTTCVVQQGWRTKSLGLVRHTELFLNLYSGNFGYHTVHPVRAISPFQSAGFLIDSVAYLLQRKSSFRQIKDNLFRELDQYQVIKGARLSCAGRLGGRSKKAQKAKTQSAQWGETSLTVFSSRLSFASKGVNTAYGKVGVKLWLCYNS